MMCVSFVALPNSSLLFFCIHVVVVVDSCGPDKLNGAELFLFLSLSLSKSFRLPVVILINKSSHRRVEQRVSLVGYRCVIYWLTFL